MLPARSSLPIIDSASCTPGTNGNDNKSIEEETKLTTKEGVEEGVAEFAE